MPVVVTKVPKKVQVRKTIDAIEFKRLTIDREAKIYSCDVKLDPAIEVALIRLELKDYPQLFVRCPVKTIFKSADGATGTIVADVPDAEIERLNKEKVKLD